MQLNATLVQSHQYRNRSSPRLQGTEERGRDENGAREEYRKQAVEEKNVRTRLSSLPKDT